jgi:hypothetical protein
LWAGYQKALGNEEKELIHLNKIAVKSLSDKLTYSVLHSIFILELSQSKFKDAHSTYLKLSKLYTDKPCLTEYKKLINKGELDQLDIHCSNNRYIYTIGEESIWKALKKWKTVFFMYMPIKIQNLT